MAEPQKNDDEKALPKTVGEAVDAADAADAVSDDETTPFDDDRTDRAIDDIVAREGDEVLKAQDAAIAEQNKAEPKRGFFGRLLHNKWFRRIVMLLFLGGVGAAAGIPTSRYWILNTAGVRVTSSVIVTDATTDLPLKGVPVVIAGQRTETDAKGQAKVTGLHLGPSELHIKQVGFAEIKKKIVLGWGSNPLGSYRLEAVGVQYAIEVKDYLSEKPVEGVTATSGDATAVSDKNGKITLTTGEVLATTDSITLTKPGYRNELVSPDPDPKQPNKLAMVLGRKAVFVTKQSGKYDVYKSDIDGKNRQVLLPGTGHENSNISLVTSPDGTRAALVSTRENKRDADGFLLSTLTLIDIENGETFIVAQAPQIQLVDWIGPRVIFQQVSSDTAAANHYMVVGYNFNDNSRVQLASANKLGTVLSAQGAVYYVVPATDSGDVSKAGFFKIGGDGNNKQNVVKGEVWSALRTAYGTIHLQMADETWKSYNIQNGAVVDGAAPASLANRLYIDNTDRTKSLWIAQSALNVLDVASNKDTLIQNKSGIAYPVQWLSHTALLYRMAGSGETADYAVSIEGGTPHKVSDVSGTYGFAQGQ